MKDKTFSIKVDGIDYTYEIVKILCPSNVRHKYIIYTDGKDLFASRFEKQNEEIVLKDIERQSEWNYIDNYLEGML